MTPESTRGMTLLEGLIVTLVITMAAAVSAMQMQNSIHLLDADRTSNLVITQLKYARQVAVNQRRNVRVDFSGTNQIQVTRIDSDDETTVLSTETLPPGFAFALPEPLEIGDTPEGYGEAQPVYFNEGTHGRFLPDGSFVDDNGVVLNGTVFTKGGPLSTARAVTLSGASSQIHVYSLDGYDWVERR